MNWSADIFPSKKLKNNNYYTFSSQQELTFFIWNSNTTAHHEHENYFEIFVVLKGKIYHYIDGKKILLQPGNAVIIPPNVSHQILPFDTTMECRYVNITCIEQKFPLYCKNLSCGDINIIKPHTLQLTDKQFSFVESYIDQIVESQHKKNDHLILSSFFSYTLSIFLFDISNVPNEDISLNAYPEWLINFLSALSALRLEDIQINELYKLSGYSQSAFSIQFKKYMKQTLVQYVNDLKLDYASNLLQKTNFSHVYIANKIGFLNLGHFNRLFKQKYGITPSQYRKQFLLN